MRIIYPYNEILPKKKAHDIFIVHECAALAEQGAEVMLLVGSGSKKEDIFSHYSLPQANSLQIKSLFMMRKNNLLGVSWNFPFFWGAQHTIQSLKPDWVFLSVRKQAAFHLKRKIPGVRYLYEVHELGYYPGLPLENQKQLELEKTILDQVDLITVTTAPLKEILLRPPYCIKTPITVVPLAVQASQLTSPLKKADPLMLMYVGQLYTGQGVATLLSSMRGIENVRLKIVGGRSEEIKNLKKLAKELSVEGSVEFLGFVAPAKLPQIVKEAHALVAPFENSGRMPYVAHTKLCEYSEWGRPIIAPDLPIVLEHFPDRKGTLLFTPDDPLSLAKCITLLKEDNLRKQLQAEIHTLAGRYSWHTRASTYKTLLETH